MDTTNREHPRSAIDGFSAKLRKKKFFSFLSNEIHCTVLDISARGIGLLSESSFDEGDEVDIIISSRNIPNIRTIGLIKYCIEYQDIYRIGILLTHIDPSISHQLDIVKASYGKS